MKKRIFLSSGRPPHALQTRNGKFRIVSLLLAVLLFAMGCGGGELAPSASVDEAVQPGAASAGAAEPAPEPAPTGDPQAETDEQLGFVEDGASAAYFDRSGGELSQRVMMCFDSGGSVTSVKERFVGPAGADYSEEPNDWRFLADGEWVSLDNTVCFFWDAQSISRWFGGLSQAEAEAQLVDWPDQLPNRTIEYHEIPFGEQLYSGNGLILTLDTVQFAPNESIGITVSAKSTGNDFLLYYVSELYINGWEVDIIGNATAIAGMDANVSQTFWAGDADLPAYRAMQIGAIESVGMYVRVIKNGDWRKGQYTDVVSNPAAGSYTQHYDDSGTVLLDDDTIRVVQRRLDAKYGRAELYVEKKNTSRWSQVLLDGVFDGYGGGNSTSYNLQQDMRAIVEVDGSDVCRINGISEVSELAVYLTYYHSDRLQKPVKLTIQNSNAAPNGEGTRTARGEVLFDGKYCTIRYLGVTDSYFSNADVILLECENKTDDRYLSVYQAFNYLLLDETRADAGMSGANCYPNSISTMALYPSSSDYNDLSDYAVAQLKLGVYEIKGGYHQQLEMTSVLSLDLSKIYSRG